MSDKPKIGAGHASAMFRLGFRELRNAANPSRESVADSEMGLYATRTPGEVAEIRHGDERPQDHNQQRNIHSYEQER